MQNEGRQENKKCDVRNYGWEGKSENMEWTDDIRVWCKQDLYSLSRIAQKRELWKQMIKF